MATSKNTQATPDSTETTPKRDTRVKVDYESLKSATTSLIRRYEKFQENNESESIEELNEALLSLQKVDIVFSQRELEAKMAALKAK